MSHFHAVVWLDHRAAHVFQINPHEAEGIRVTPHPPLHAAAHGARLHHAAGSRDGKRSPVDPDYYRSIVEALLDAKEWLIVGPGTAKLELLKHIQRHHADLIDRVIGIETVDHPTDAQLVSHARHYFAGADRMRSQTA